ncbi:MAG: hypothetical protein KJ593_02880 [Candidatus Omnitrophica bacterium]|nr:hypothetical protein [Candidatus Omnitrophota bacterium]
MQWQGVFIEPVKGMLTQIGGFLTSFFYTVLILLVGWLIARLIKNVVIKLLKVVRLDVAAEQVGVNKFLAKGGIGSSLSELVGLLCYWLALLIIVVVAINAMGLDVAADLLNRIVLYVPNVIISIFILVLGMFLATFLGKTITTAASNTGVQQPQLLGRIVEMIVIIFSIIIVLEQLQIGANVFTWIVIITLSSLGLGFAIAFGLGCKDIVGKLVTEAIEKLKSKR